jgi:hypothetical protein
MVKGWRKLEWIWEGLAWIWPGLAWGWIGQRQCLPDVLAESDLVGVEF